MNDANWKSEYLSMKSVSKFQRELLTNGPHSLSQSWLLQAYYCEWKRMKGYKEPERPDCRSSFKEWNSAIST